MSTGSLDAMASNRAGNPRGRRAVWVLLLVFGCGLLSPAEAVRRRDQEPVQGGVPEEEEFREANIAPPAFPQDSRLVEFTVTGRSSNRFFVDPATLTVGPDKIIRFAVVVRSASGAKTVSFSGVHCKTREWKDYAYGYDGSWRKVENPQWRPIHEKGINNYQETLFSEFFCFGGAVSGGPMGDAKTIVRYLKTAPAKDPHTPRTLY
jgi:CNP1-like family protein